MTKCIDAECFISELAYRRIVMRLLYRTLLIRPPDDSHRPCILLLYFLKL